MPPLPYSYNQEDIAEARSGTYRFFAHLFAAEPDGRWLEFLGKNSDYLANLNLPPKEAENEFLELLQVEYANIFLLNLYPYESVFVGAEPMLNTGETEAVQQFYHRYNFSVGGVRGKIKNLPPDHLSAELRFLGFLAKYEAQARRENQPRKAELLGRSAYTFLQKHLLCWLPVMSLNVARVTRHDFYPNLTAQALSFVLFDYQHLQELYRDNEPVSLNLANEPNFAYESLPDVVNFLITPSRSGFLLTKIEIGRLAKQLQLPPGGENRFQMLWALFEQAARYEVLPVLLSALADIATEYMQALENLAKEFPFALTILNLAHTKIKRTLSLLQQMQSLVNQFAI